MWSGTALPALRRLRRWVRRPLPVPDREPEASARQAPLYFLHLPKTGGTSFTAALFQHFPPEVVCPAHLWHDLLALPPESLAGYRLFRGHFYGHLYPLLPFPVRTITFLREPVARSLSHYAHVLRAPEHYHHRRAHELGGIRGFLRDPETRPLVRNFQTRMLALELDPIRAARALGPDRLAALELERWVECAEDPTLSDDDLLRRAKARLESCVFVGITERMTDSLALLAPRVGWPAVPRSCYLNRTPRRQHPPAPDPETLRLVAAETELDRELYRWALERLTRLAVEREHAHRPLPAPLPARQRGG